MEGQQLAAVPDLSGANLRGSDLSEVDLSGANLNGADLRSADLRKANLSSADLGKINLNGANLGGASLHRAKLNGASLGGGTDLTGADLSDADLSRADLSDAHLGQADLSEVQLSGTNFRRADLSGVDLRAATLRWTIFADTNLSGARGLESCRHAGPSTIGIDTFFKSKGDIPESFLRGCGVPEQFITYARSLIGQPIEFYSCFISYSTKDQEFADRLHADLQNRGVRCWFAPHSISGGKKIHEQIDEAIRVYDRLLLIVSEHSMKSGWVETELSKARKREIQEHRRMLFPVRLVDFETLRQWERIDEETGKDLGREIREYFVPDFSRWKDHDEYKKAFDRLLRDLKT